MNGRRIAARIAELEATERRLSQERDQIQARYDALREMLSVDQYDRLVQRWPQETDRDLHVLASILRGAREAGETTTSIDTALQLINDLILARREIKEQREASMDEERIARLRAGPIPPKPAQLQRWQREPDSEDEHARDAELLAALVEATGGATPAAPARRADLPAEIIDQLRRIRQDIIVEGKQEGPWAIGADVNRMEFQLVAGRAVLLPGDTALDVVRCIVSADAQCLTIFGRGSALGVDLDGWIMVADRWPDADWYLPTVWHLWSPAAAELAEQLAAMDE